MWVVLDAQVRRATAYLAARDSTHDVWTVAPLVHPPPPLLTLTGRLSISMRHNM